ncbi:hypothetical protein BSKO_13322 [Bryopsis sp. KO-2023]|nr:hypothetical protein BSKO_13322 [Bryopsis sp. KO-2023]
MQPRLRHSAAMLAQPPLRELAPSLKTTEECHRHDLDRRQKLTPKSSDVFAIFEKRENALWSFINFKVYLGQGPPISVVGCYFMPSQYKQRDFSGKATFAEAANVQQQKEISESKRTALYNSNIFGDASPLKAPQVSDMKRRSLQGAQSQAVLGGPAGPTAPQRPIRGGMREPGGGCQIGFGH